MRCMSAAQVTASSSGWATIMRLRPKRGTRESIDFSDAYPLIESARIVLEAIQAEQELMLFPSLTFALILLTNGPARVATVRAKETEGFTSRGEALKPRLSGINASTRDVSRATLRQSVAT